MAPFKAVSKVQHITSALWGCLPAIICRKKDCQIKRLRIREALDNFHGKFSSEKPVGISVQFTLHSKQ